MFLVLAGQTPSKKNSRIIDTRSGYPRVLPSKFYREWEEAQLWQILATTKEKFAGPVKVTMTYFSHNKQKSDLTNRAESVMDLLVKAGIIPDDNWGVVPEVVLKFGGVSKDEPRAEVTIEPVK